LIRSARLAGVALCLGLALGPAGPATARDTRSPTIVSLEFDHATSDELPGIARAAALRMPVTLFALSGRVGTPGYMTVAQLRRLQAAGDEIGGHTVDHADLSKLSPAAQRAEICGDRAALQADGLRITDFAYPYGHFDAATPAIVRACGYQSARGTGGLASPGGCSGACPDVESVPPAKPFDTRTVNSVLDTTSPATLERYVTRAERRRGGWIQIVFHHVCDRCDQYAVSLPTLGRFLAWLARRRARGTVVRTVRQVIERPVRRRPTSSSCASSSCASSWACASCGAPAAWWKPGRRRSPPNLRRPAPRATRPRGQWSWRSAVPPGVRSG
jgi:peptidoglycan/xylan/chitin deacetylase (PgdA/CDA1 family)